MSEGLNRMDREQIIFQLMANTRYAEDVLEKMSDEKLLEMYKLKVEPNMK